MKTTTALLVPAWIALTLVACKGSAVHKQELAEGGHSPSSAAGLCASVSRKARQKPWTRRAMVGSVMVLPVRRVPDRAECPGRLERFPCVEDSPILPGAGARREGGAR